MDWSPYPFKSYEGRFTVDNSLFMNTDVDVKHVFGGLNHASLFYQIEFHQTLGVGLGKLILADQSTAKDRIKLADDQFIWGSEEPIKLNLEGPETDEKFEDAFLISREYQDYQRVDSGG